MRICLIHIGVHRTGTSAFQHVLGHARDRLAEAGILVPVADDRRITGAHHNLSHDLGALREARSGGFGLADLAAQLAASDAGHAVISTETLSVRSVQRSHVDRLLETVRGAGFEPVVLVVVRPQPELLVSTYAQLVRTLSERGSMAEFLEASLPGAAYDYALRLQAWTGRDDTRLVVLPYGDGLAGPRIADTLLAAGGIPQDVIARAALPDADQRNASIGPEAVAAMRHLMRERPDLAEARRIQPVAMEVAGRRGWLGIPFRGLGPDDVARIRARYAASNDAFARRHWGRAWDEVFPPAPARGAANEIDLDAISPATRASFDAFVAEVAAEIDRRAARRAGPGGFLDRIRSALGLGRS